MNNQLELKLSIKDVININTILFFEVKNFGKFLFISSELEGIIYNIKFFKIFKKI